MNTAILILSATGILNSLILIIYSLVTKKGEKTTNILFAVLVFVLSLRISKSILITINYTRFDYLLMFGLVGFLSIGPAFLLFTTSAIEIRYKIKPIDIIHFLPSIILIPLWFSISAVRKGLDYSELFYYAIIVQYLIYSIFTVVKINSVTKNNKYLKNQLITIAVFILLIWLTYFLHEVASLTYISGAIVYCIIIYFTLFILLNKGHIINQKSNHKYEKTHITDIENERILSGLKELFESEKLYRDNLISLKSLAQKLNTSTHILSRVINENHNMSFNEMIRLFRINDAKKVLKDPDCKNTISNIAFKVGYNSISAFNESFKKITNMTPTQYRGKSRTNQT